MSTSFEDKWQAAIDEVPEGTVVGELTIKPGDRFLTTHSIDCPVCKEEIPLLGIIGIFECLLVCSRCADMKDEIDCQRPLKRG